GPSTSPESAPAHARSNPGGATSSRERTGNSSRTEVWSRSRGTSAHATTSRPSSERPSRSTFAAARKRDKHPQKASWSAVLGCYKLAREIGMLAVMDPARANFDPAGAGIVLATVTASCIGVGALIGWGAGNVGYGVLCGA